MEKKLETLYDLCEIVSRELEDCNEKIRKAGGKLSPGDVEYLDKLTHMLKSLKTTIAMMESEDEEGGYSGRYVPRMGAYYGPGGMSYAGGRGGNRGGGSNRGGSSYDGGSSYRGQRRDSMGRYSRDGGYSYAAELDGIMEDLRDVMSELPAEKRRTAEKLMAELDRM